MHWKRQLIPILLGVGVGMVLAWALTRDSAGDVRREVASTAVALARTLQQPSPMSPVEMDAVLGVARRSSTAPIAWIQLRQADNSVLAQTGIEESAAFTLQYVKARHAVRKAAVKVVQRPEGRVLVEAFPVRLGANTGSVRVLRAAYGKSSSSPANAVLEIAAYLDTVR